MKPVKVWTKWTTHKRNWDLRCEFVVCESDEDSLSLMFTSWEAEWKFSFMFYHEIDETIKFKD